MGVTASGPPFWFDPPICKCGWKWKADCKQDGGCGLNQGVPEYKHTPSPEWVRVKAGDSWPETETYDANSVHIPHEFLPNWSPDGTFGPGRVVDLNKVCREVVEDLVKEKDEKKTLRDLLGEGGWDHYKEFPDGSSEYMGKSYPKWDSNGVPVFTGWENTEPATYHGAKETPTQVGGTHYAEMEVQPWSAMKAWMSPEEYIGYHVGTVIGYLSRHKKKGGQVDIDKALHHMQELSRYLKEDAEYPY